MLRIASLLSLLFFSFSFAKTPCSFPDIWQAQVNSFGNSEFGCDATNSFSGFWYFDSINKMERFDAKGHNGPGDFFDLIVWNIYPKNITCICDKLHNNCSAERIDGNYRIPSIPEDSVYQGEVIIGEQTMDTWLIPKGEIVSVTQTSCYPVSSITLDQSPGIEVTIMTYTNVSPIVNPDLFILPSQCKLSNSNQISTKRNKSKFSHILGEVFK